MNCLCKVENMRTITAGLATYHGINGADVYLVYRGTLPEYYLDKETAKKYGWNKKKGNLFDVLPGRMIGGDVFENRNGKLPVNEGRIWYEADINYSTGYRTKARILFSNDGLIFSTYDHYRTFYEIVGGNHVQF
ncbi:MAG: ribonuclease [Clostridia bacterium]|nr:ribonuclease [Clostridia bacterium]